MRVRFCIFFRYAQIKNMRIQYKTILGNFKMLDLVMFFSIQDMFPVGSKVSPKVYIITVAAEAIAAVRIDLDGALFYFFQDTAIGKDHTCLFLNSTNVHLCRAA